MLTLTIFGQMLGHETMESVIGPMGRTIQDLQFFLKILLQSEPWKADPKVLRLPWRDGETEDVTAKISDKKLTFGVLRCDGTVRPHPPVRRVIDEAVDKLVGAGYEVSGTFFLPPHLMTRVMDLVLMACQVIDWDPPSHAEAYGIAVSPTSTY